MKVALLIAGYLRSYSENINFIKKEIIDKYKDVDVYLHITNSENSEDKYFNQIDDSDIKRITSDLNPISTIIEKNIHYTDDKLMNNLINHWSKLYKLNSLKKLTEEYKDEKYDLVIRYRPDLSIKTENIFYEFAKGVVFIPKDSKIDKIRLTKPTDKYLCDALAFGDSVSMDNYFNIYKNLSKLMANHGVVSETLLYKYLNLFNINYKLIDIEYSFLLSKCNVFAICGDSGSGKSTLSNLLKDTFTDSFKLECDRYHKWERTNRNWDTITHLNPRANYITKMNEDIFNLKVGNEIFQVDYNHNNGKFTDKQLINPANNLIVCGLHSLYGKHELFDLKIYMDTDDNLKKKWKIIRDVKERGYTVEKVLESIEKRSADFIQYIEPQKDASDLIIRFFTVEEVNFNDLDANPKISLEISISNVFNTEKIQEILKTKSILFTTSFNDKFTKFIFLDYENINFFSSVEIPITGTFYDYILFFIFQLGFTNQ